MRFFTVPNAKAARSSVVWAMFLIGFFYLLTTFIGFGARAFLGQEGVEAAGTAGNLAAPNLAQFLGGGEGTFGGDLFLAVIAGVAFATILAVVAGPRAVGVGAPWRTTSGRTSCARARSPSTRRSCVAPHRRGRDRRDRDRRSPSSAATGLNVSFMVGLAFAVAASANFPALLLALTWRRFNTAGAVTGVLFGVISAIFLVIVSPKVWPGADTETGSPIGWTLANPGIVSIPLGFIGCWLGHDAHQGARRRAHVPRAATSGPRPGSARSERSPRRANGDNAPAAPAGGGRRRGVHPTSSGGERAWQTERRSSPSSRSCSTRRRFDPPEEFAEQALVTDESVYEAADDDSEGFWAEQAEDAALVRAVGPGARLVEPAVRQVVRRRQAQRLLQLPRPPRRGRQRRPRRLPLARRGGRGARRHLRGPARDVQRFANALKDLGIEQGRRRRDLPADDPRGRVAMLACARIGATAQRRLRRLLGRVGQGAHGVLRGEGAGHRRRRAAQGQDRADQGVGRRGDGRRRSRSRRSSSSSAPTTTAR